MDNLIINNNVFIPPDNALAVGVSHVFQMVNNVGRITDRLGGVASTFSLRDFFATDPGFDVTDPRLIYDARTGRWFGVYLESSSSLRLSSLILSVSMSSDPTGPFCRYHLGNPSWETFIQDYPMIGISDDKIAVSYHAFDFGTGALLGGGYYVLNKAHLLACGIVDRIRTALDPLTLWKPGQSLSSTSTLYMAAHSFLTAVDHVVVLSIDGVPGISTVTSAQRTLPIASWDVPPNASQAGSGVLLVVDVRTQGVVWRDGRLWVAGNGACTPLGDVAVRSCLRLVEVATDTMTVRQDIVFGQANKYYFDPALQVDSDGNLHVVFMRSGADEFLQVRATGRLATDPANVLQPSILLRSGDGAQTDSRGRVGDYCAAATDPVVPQAVWVSGEYIRLTAEMNWGTYIAQLQFPLPMFDLGVAKAGTGAGSVTSSPGGISCGATCSATFNSGTTVTLTAAAANGSTFVDWSGCDSTSGAGCTVTVSAARTVTVTFTALPTVTTTAATNVTATGATINGSVNPNGSATTVMFQYGLTTAYGSATGSANAGSGTTAANWQANLTGLTCATTYHYRIVATNSGGTSQGADQTFTTSPCAFALAVTKAGTGAGTVTSSPAGIDCGATCTASFISGTALTLTAAAASGSTFAGWSGACAGLAPCLVTIDAPRSVTARFERLPPDLAVSVVSLAAAVVSPGARLAVAVTVLNQGDGTAGASTTRLYLSRDAARGPGDRLLGRSLAFPPIAGGTAVSRTMTAVLPRPLAPGSYYILACADDLRRIVESDETNNCLASSAVTVAGPDLVVHAITPLTPTVVVGQRLIVRATLRNASIVSAAGSLMRFYLALEPARGPGERLLSGSRTFGPLGPNATATISTALGVPPGTPAGAYFLVACADELGRVAESDESNNCRASATSIEVRPQ